MADITLKLIWYRLGESYTNMAESYEQVGEWWQNFSWRQVDILDYFLLGWIVYAFLVVVFVELYFSKLRPSLKKAGFISSDTGQKKRAPTVDLLRGESCNWVNSTINWLYLHYSTTPDFVECWLKALNEQCKKQGFAVKFERIQPGSLPPKLSNVHTEVGPRDSLTVRMRIEFTDLGFTVSVAQMDSSVNLYSCDVSVQKLAGELSIHGNYLNEEVHLSTGFVSKPELKVHVRPRTFSQVSQDINMDARVIEEQICQAITVAQTTMSLSPRITPTDAGYVERIRTQEYTTAFSAPHSSAKNIERRLLVKVIKASGLGNRQYGVQEPYCVVEMDSPEQKHLTSIVKNTVNPFWDEHFLFDLTQHSSELKFELFDKQKPEGQNFLGQAVLMMENLRRNPSSRQIIPLQASPVRNEVVHGSLTVEFLFMEPAEAQQMQQNLELNPVPSPTRKSPAGEMISPRRTIETTRKIAPGGVLVTNRTVTTEKPVDWRYENQPVNDSPNRIHKNDSSTNFRPISAEPNNSSPREQGLGDSSVSSSQDRRAHPEINQPASSYPSTIQSVGYARASTLPTPRMTESTPTEEHKDDRSLSTSTTTSGDRDKKGRSLTSTIRKRFSRSLLRGKPRSHSADRAAVMAREENLLKPPDSRGNQPRTTDDLDHLEPPKDNLHKSRSLSNSLRKLFRRKKKGDGSTPAPSRDSSMSRESSWRQRDMSREGSVGQHSPGHLEAGLSTPDSSLYHPSPDISARETPIYHRSSFGNP